MPTPFPINRFPRWVTSPCDAHNLREVGPGLFVGAARAPTRRPFDTIVDFYGSSLSPDMDSWLRDAYTRTRSVVRVPFPDGYDFPAGALDLIWAAVRGAQGPILLHCHAGLSRSASAAYAMLRRWNGLDHDTARYLVTVRTGFPLAPTLASARRWVQATRGRPDTTVVTERRA